MKRIITLFIMAIIVIFETFTQESANDYSSYDTYISKKGVIIKIQDFRLPWMEGIGYSVYQNRIRLVCNAETENYFLQIIKDQKNGDIICSLEYNEIVEMINSIKVLQIQYKEDCSRTIEYLENKYINNNGIQVGYIISDLERGWFMKLDKYKAESIILFKESNEILNGLQEAIKKVEEIKK